MRVLSLISLLLDDSLRLLLGLLRFHDKRISGYSVVFHVDICV